MNLGMILLSPAVAFQGDRMVRKENLAGLLCLGLDCWDRGLLPISQRLLHAIMPRGRRVSQLTLDLNLLCAHDCLGAAISYSNNLSL